jgi:soluble lytic murein transglycosylase
MRASSKTLTTLLFAIMASGAPVGAEEAKHKAKAKSGGPAKPAQQAKAKAKVQAKSPAKAPAKTAASDDKAAAASKPVSTLPPLPVPRPLPEEAEHTARYDAAIAPARDYAVSAEDQGRLREAVAAVGGGKLQHAVALREQITDPAGRKLVSWYIHRSGYGSAQEVRAFLDANPDWPDRWLLNQRAEEDLLESQAGPKEVRTFFGDQQPKTAAGLGALAAALLADKEESRARALAVKAWTEHDISAGVETLLLKRVGPLLTGADHKRRLDRLLLNDSRWASERKEQAAVIRRVIGMLTGEEKKKAEARLAVFLRAKNASQLISKYSKYAKTDWGLAVQRSQALRRQKKDEEAWKTMLLEAEPVDFAKPDGWWEERRATAYAALKAGKPKTAYELVRDPGALSVNAGKDASFMAGWLALRHLGNARQALDHFESLAKEADGPLSHARSQYWVGRVHEALGDAAKARRHYQAAAGYFDTFHGQLARLKLDPGAGALKITPPVAPTAEQVQRFNRSDAIRAIVVARKAGLDTSLTRAFLVHLRRHLGTEAEVAMLAHLAHALGDTQGSLRIGKAGIARGMNLVYYAYPLHGLPQYTPLRNPPEPAVILGIARQESEFNTATLSGAGARGILQVMPITARHVCRDYKIKCQIDRLMKDAAYNTMLGSAYIADRMAEFGGSYVLTLAGYNAGPSRAREWIKEFGDPRNKDVDPLDWIYRIPFEETRDYVQKVLSNIQVYRARLGEANAVRINADLKRLGGAGAAAKSADASQ